MRFIPCTGKWTLLFICIYLVMNSSGVELNDEVILMDYYLKVLSVVVSSNLKLLQINFRVFENWAIPMATEPKPASEDVKVDLFEDDDEFEEFEINEEWDDKEEGKEVTQQWEDDWDDDDVSDDFSLQLKRELEGNAEKK
ncbi:hypothetical protein RJT34_33324 [Clitoria ternatea]|uniref:26S proteasome complex subunit SEM1 n=1 Tax=Clitoria ternatea TaxID=43366 RepID=A0AAN9EYK2_CLITE